MATLLHIDSSASPLAQSRSRQLTADYARQWQSVNNTGEYRYRDVAADPVPFSGAAYAALGQRLEHDGPISHREVAARVQSDAERAEWKLSEPLIDEVIAADTIVLGVPMYNFSVPAALKAWIDRVTFPGVYVDPQTQEQRLADTEVVVVCARGGAYGPETPRHAFDFQEPFLRSWLTSHLGISDGAIQFINVEMTRADDVPYLHQFREFGEQSLAAARTAVQRLSRAGAGKDELTSAATR